MADDDVDRTDTGDRAPVVDTNPRQWEWLVTLPPAQLRMLAGALGVDAGHTLDRQTLATEVAAALGGDEPVLAHAPRTGDLQPST